MFRYCHPQVFNDGPNIDAILMLGGTVWVVGFPEEMSPQLLQLAEKGAKIVDLERELGAFNIRLGRPYLG